LPKDARPYRTPVAKAMAFPNNVVKEKLKNTGNSAILKEEAKTQSTGRLITPTCSAVLCSCELFTHLDHGYSLLVME